MSIARMDFFCKQPDCAKTNEIVWLGVLLSVSSLSRRETHAQRGGRVAPKDVHISLLPL